jgi:hypothetical protein
MHTVSPFLIDRNIRPSHLDSLQLSALVKFARVNYVDLLTSGTEVNPEMKAIFL